MMNAKRCGKCGSLLPLVKTECPWCGCKELTEITVVENGVEKS
jgi:RNA polymerase subunit RPABC4/transcription elongation factor Spt4